MVVPTHCGTRRTRKPPRNQRRIQRIAGATTVRGGGHIGVGIPLDLGSGQSVASQRVARIGNPESHTRTETVAHVVNGNEVGMGNCTQSEGGILVSCELWRGIICPPTRGRFARASEPDAGTRRSS